MGTRRFGIVLGFALVLLMPQAFGGAPPINTPDGVILPHRIVQPLVAAGQKVKVTFNGAVGAYGYLQYRDLSSSNNWQNFSVDHTALSEFFDLDGASDRMYRVRSTVGALPTLSIEVVGGISQADHISLSVPFFRSWNYVLESRAVVNPSLGAALWMPLASSSTNATFITRKIAGQEYRVRAIPPVKRENYETILVGGQSNALMYDDLSWGERVKDVVYFSEFLHRYGEFLTPARATYSFSLQGAIDLSDSSARKYLLIPVAVGGTPMKQWFPTADRYDVLTLFGRANYRRVLGSPNTPAAIWYYGHESSMAPLEEYIPDWKQLIAEFRKDAGPAPLIYAQLAKHSDAGVHNAMRLAADRQRLTEEGQPDAVAAAHLVVTFDLPLADGLHLSVEGQRLLGKRFALAMREHVYKENINGTGPRLVEIINPASASNLVLVTFNKAVNEAVNFYENEFRVSSGGVEVPIRGIRRARNAEQIEIELTRNPGGELFVEYGVQPSKSNNSYLANVVRDSDQLPAPVFGPVKAVRR